jgi:hypothetical protein
MSVGTWGGSACHSARPLKGAGACAGGGAWNVTTLQSPGGTQGRPSAWSARSSSSAQQVRMLSDQECHVTAAPPHPATPAPPHSAQVVCAACPPPRLTWPKPTAAAASCEAAAQSCTQATSPQLSRRKLMLLPACTVAAQQQQQGADRQPTGQSGGRPALMQHLQQWQRGR